MKDSIDRCDLCGGELKAGQTTLEIWRGEETSADVSERLDFFLKGYQQRRPERYLAVPQFSAVQIMEG
jgi:hypothetical protein